jgi:hypothetical protein
MGTRPLRCCALLSIVWLSAAGVASAQPFTRADRARERELAVKTDAFLTTVFRKETFATCEDLVQAAQSEVFSLYTFEPADSLREDVECEGAPLFSFAERIHERAHAKARAVMTARVSGMEMAREAVRAELRAIKGGGAGNQDVLGSLAGSIRDGQYGTAVRHLGSLNTALTCSSLNSLRVVDYLLARITQATLDSGLPASEQRECLQGTFNAALNAFDRVQYTGGSLVQTVYSREMARIRPLLTPEYPRCDLGILVYDFATGKLVRLRDPECPSETVPGSTPAAGSTGGGGSGGGASGGARLAERERMSRAVPIDRQLTASLTGQPKHYLEGFLDAFADPRRFGTGDCSLLRMTGADFQCFAGLECPQGGSAATGLLRPDRAVAVDPRTAVLDPSSGAGVVPERSGNPKRFGLPFGGAEGYLCGLAGGRPGDSAGRGAFGRAGWMQLPSEAFFDCQVSTLFGTMQDETTACMMNAIREMLDLGARAGDDPSVVMGGMKDPRCMSGTPSEDARTYVRQHPDRVRTRSSLKTYDLVNRVTGTPSERQTYDSKINADLAYNAVNRAVAQVDPNMMVIYGESRVADAAYTARAAEVRLVEGLDEAVAGDGAPPGAGTHATQQADGEWVVFVDEKIMDATGTNLKAYQASIGNARVQIFNEELKKPASDQEKKDQQEQQEAQRPEREEEGAQDPGYFDEGTSNACTSAVARARQALASCGTPQRAQPDVTSSQAYGGANPDLINPGPDGVFLGPSTLLDLSACIDQYGRDIKRLNGSMYGPGGCVPPFIACSRSSCSSYESNCEFWGQWQCSYAMCREDQYCCGGPTSSHGAGGGSTPGERTAGQIECADGNVWNASRRRCQPGSICPEGTEFQPGTNVCAPVTGPPGRPPGPPR